MRERGCLIFKKSKNVDLTSGKYRVTIQYIPREMRKLMKYAVIDIGSNTVKMSLFSENKTLIQKYSQSVRLLSHIENGSLTQIGTETLIHTLKTFQLFLLAYEPIHTVCYATAALRAVANRQAVTDAVKNETGLTVDVLSGEEEAALSLKGIALVSGINTEKAAFFDLGGGSLEVVIPRGTAPCIHSFPLGALRLYHAFLHTVYPNAEELQAIYHHAQTLADKEKLPCHSGRVLAVGGTLRAAASLLAHCEGKRYDETLPYVITRDMLVSLLSDIVTGDSTTRQVLSEHLPERKHTLAPGLCAFLALLDAIKADTFTLVNGGVREGYLAKITERA